MVETSLFERTPWRSDAKEERLSRYRKYLAQHPERPALDPDEDQGFLLFEIANLVSPQRTPRPLRCRDR